jgi:hypothetical protein
MTPISRFCVLGIALLAAATPGSLAAPATGLAGSWQAEQSPPGGAPGAATLVFTRNGTTLSGVMRGATGDMPLFEVKEAGSTVSFTLIIPGTPYVSVRYSGAMTGDELKLASGDDGHGVYTLTAHRSGGTPTRAATAAPTDETPARIATLDTPALRPSQLPPLLSQTPPPRPAPPAAAASNQTARGRLEGAWTARQESPGSAAPIDASLTFTGNRGVMRVGSADWPLFEVRDTGAEVSFTLIIPGQPYGFIMRAASRTECFSSPVSMRARGRFVYRRPGRTRPLLPLRVLP